MGIELGLGQVQSLQSIHVIQGRPSISAQTMIALIRNKFPDAYIKIEDGEGFSTCAMARCQEDKENAYVAKWDMSKAKSMGLANKDNWQKQPQTMMRWRAVSEAARFVFPDAIMNLYTPEENEEIPKTFEQELEEDFPNPNQNIEIGSAEWKILYGSLRGKFLKELSIEELEHRIEYLERKYAAKGLDDKYMEELTSLQMYHSSVTEG